MTSARHRETAPRSRDVGRLRDESPLLAERVKELDCLYAISKLLERATAGIDDVLTRVVETLCSAWQYPEVTQASIVLDGHAYLSREPEPLVASQACPIIARGTIVGRLEVAYVQPRPDCDEGPFLHEERQLLNVVAQRLGEYIERQQDRERLVAYQEKLRALSAELALSEERERRRIAQALHDRIGQVLALVNIKLGASLELTTEAPVYRELLDVRRLVGEIITDSRQLTFELSPPMLYELGLEAALDWLAETVERDYGVRVDCRFPSHPVALDEVPRVVLFQCVRELVVNACRHARVDTVQVRLRRSSDTVSVTVSDEGVGMDLARLRRPDQTRGFGLFSTRERIGDLGGSFSIESEPGRGLRVELTLPVSPDAAGHLPQAAETHRSAP